MSQYVFPTLIILMSCGASVFYGASGDLRQTVYWAAAAVITFVVTF